MCMINPNVYDRAVVPHIPSIPSQDWPVIQMTRASGSSIWWSSGSDASLYTHEEKSRMAKGRTERLKKGEVTGKKDYYKNQMGKWTVCFYSFHLLSLEWSSANLWGCKFWGEPPITPFTWISCPADLCNLFSQFMFCILPPSLTPATSSYRCLLLLPRWSFKKIGCQATISLYLGWCFRIGWSVAVPMTNSPSRIPPFLFQVSKMRAKVSAICVCTRRVHTETRKDDL